MPDLMQHLPEAGDVGVVQRSVDLVQDREGGRVDLLKGQHEGERGERALA